MIKTFFGTGTLDTSAAFLAALIIGVFFGVALERAGFGSSRKLTGVFYFEDMAVIKVMFSALITAMLGLAYFQALGFIGPDELYFMPTIYGAQIMGGLIFGVGFVMGGWCPGTAAVGLASGKLDALIFLGGAILGSIGFNELFPVVRPLYTWGSRGVVFIYQTLNLSQGSFALIFTLIAVACFWGVEFLEGQRGKATPKGYGKFLTSVSVGLVVLAMGFTLLPGTPLPSGGRASGEESILAQVEGGRDHFEPEELADRLMRGEPNLLVVDIRPPGEYQSFHILGAVNIPLSKMPKELAPYKNRGVIVLYSNGMTHPAQARDSLYRQGYGNVYLLTDGLKGFMERCLKPVSLRSEPLSPEVAARVRAWRAYFIQAAQVPAAAAMVAPPSDQLPEPLPGLVDPPWLARHLGQPWLKIIDLRSQPEYNSIHIPGSLRLDVESLRGLVNGVPSMLLPPALLAGQFSLLGIHPTDLLVFVSGGKFHDGTLAGMACERLGHRRYAILQGGMGAWLAAKQPLDARLPRVVPSRYPVSSKDDFTVDYQRVLKAMQEKTTIILDVRPADYYHGKKTDEARAGHIPVAINRPYTEDLVKAEQQVRLKPVKELAGAYEKTISSRDTPVIVHCRTGHQASQTFFVLKRLLGYKNVYYYDAGWTEWAARLELPVAPMMNK
ncbi:MAG: sulfurtransferase [Deltaproteobacteria bacterium]|nr:MAG: sulfurtransferase [Deltaproteobacteria bacterium]